MNFRINFILFLSLFYHFSLIAQTPQVPKVIQYADMTLRLNDHARREIQLDVDALYRSPTYFQMKLDRVNLYMPTIERVLREQGVPDDLKYLVIQESSLIADAVSTSNAVGFWQFKKGTAEEVNLRVDNQIDERKNIVSSTKGAALYLKKHQGYLDNWACALVSYQMGLGGARKYFGDKYKRQRTMDIDRNTHWYLKKFLAHKIAFEGQLGKFVSHGSYLHEYKVNGATTLAKIAKELGVSEAHLKEHNKWTSNGRIPGDRTYTLTYLQQGIAPDRPLLASKDPEVDYEIRTNPALSPYPRITGNKSLEDQPGEIRVNGIKGILARKTVSLEDFSDQSGVREKKIRRVNDLKKSDKIIGGQYYYTKRKKGKAEVEEHIVNPGETLWHISQVYGIRLHSLKAKNRIYKDADLKPGMVLKLREYRRRNEEIKMVQPVKDPVRSTSNPTKVNTASASQKTNTPTRSEPVQEHGIYHRVQAGDTLYAISRKYNVSVEDLRIWNQLNHESIISVGQVIMIRK
jgi:membrane-bound lytic murein transglycosylase D